MTDECDQIPGETPLPRTSGHLPIRNKLRAQPQGTSLWYSREKGKLWRYQIDPKRAADFAADFEVWGES